MLDPGNGPKVHRQSLLRFRRPATGVSGHESLSLSEDDESRFSPTRGACGRGELSSDEKADGFDFLVGDCTEGAEVTSDEVLAVRECDIAE